MRLFAALAVVLVALVVVTVRGLRRPPRRPPPTDVEIAAIDPPETAARGATSPAPIRRESDGIAHLRGRVLFPAGVEAAEDLEVAAEGPTRRVIAQITEDRRFDIHLPSGRYTLVASAGVLVGVVPDVLIGSGAVRDVDIRLATGATIRGRVRAPDDVDGEVGIIAVPTGRDEESGAPEVDDGRFSIGGLIAGRQYDIIFRGTGLRTLKLIGISAPVDGLDVELRARAEVRGAIGFPRGGECPISNAALQIGGKAIGGEDEDEASVDVGDDCSFTLVVPDQVAIVTVVATGDGWHLEEQVAIPPSGDPEPVCLNPPCRSDPTEGRARLRLMLEGSPAPLGLTATAMTDDSSSTRHRIHTCSTGADKCDIDGLRPGQTFLITAGGIDCRAAPLSVTVAPGDNHVRIPCIRQRQIEGVVRVPPGEWLGRISVRCPGGGDVRPVSGTRLFELTCKADATAVEYQIGSEGTWRSVPVPLASAEDPAFVDIGPL